MNRHGLTADGSAAREDDGVIFRVFDKEVKHCLVIKLRVEIVHLLRVTTVVVDNVGRDSLSEVGLEAIDAHFKQRAKFALEPVASRRVGEVDNRVAGLPKVPLPH